MNKKKITIIVVSIIVAIIVLVVLPLKFLVIQGGWTTSHGWLLCQYIETRQPDFGDGAIYEWKFKILGIPIASGPIENSIEPFNKPVEQTEKKLKLIDKDDIIKVTLKSKNEETIIEYKDDETIDTLYSILKKLTTTNNERFENLEESYTIILYGSDGALVGSDNDIFKAVINVYEYNDKYYVMNPNKDGIYELTEEEFNIIKNYIVSNVSPQLIENVDYIIDHEYPIENWDLTRRGYHIDSIDEPNAPYYYIICMGEKPSSGYSINVKEINKKNDSIEIIVEESSISEGKMAVVLTVLTYPSVVVKFPEYQENIVIKNTKGVEFTELEPRQLKLPIRNEIIDIEIEDKINKKTITYYDNDEKIDTIYNILKELKTKKMGSWNHYHESEEIYNITFHDDKDIIVLIYKKNNGEENKYYAMGSDVPAVYELTEDEYNTIKEYASSNHIIK